MKTNDKSSILLVFVCDWLNVRLCIVVKQPYISSVFALNLMMQQSLVRQCKQVDRLVTDLLAVKLPPCSCYLPFLHLLSLSELVCGHICRASKLGLQRVTIHASSIKITLGGLSQAHITQLFRYISALTAIGAFYY